MGKALIIKGADFSLISISSTEINIIELMPDNETINIVPTSESYGSVQTLTSNTRLATASNILIKKGGSITLKGLQGIDGVNQPLRVDYCAYRQDERIKDNVITTGSKGVSENYFPFNIEGNDSVVIVNDTGEDAYFGFCFSGITKTEKIYKDNYQISYSL